ncbi:MAG: DUF2064 domain-containing protein, partial [Leptospiraceae bacterium]|nr:DUF2064 domain-containing protein [Leptospiraceae bacterium]
ENDTVLGPASDGGYYLIGMRAELAAQREKVLRLLADINWSTSTVYAQQQDRLRQAGLSVAGLPTMNDLDTFSDLMHARNLNGFYLHAFIPDIRVILPVYNEAENLEYVLRPLIASHMFREIICADNGSTDDSPVIARSLGCHVTRCAERGYGATCLEAMRHIEAQGGCDVILFMDADGSDDPAHLSELLAPLVSNRADMVLGHRAADRAEAGALLPHQRFGNWLSTFLIRIFWKHAYADLGPFRGLRWSALRQLRMRDRNFGWTVEMQIRALKAKLRILEIPVRYRRRHAGRSKVTATVRGSFRAGQIILTTVFRELWQTVRRHD